MKKKRQSSASSVRRNNTHNKCAQSNVKLKVKNLIIDESVQARESLKEKAVNEYAEMMTNENPFPPIIVFANGQRYIVADGFHRVAASKKAGKKHIKAEVRKGSMRDAMFYATGANADHGVRRTNKDKRKAVRTLLLDKKWREQSDSEIAEHCSVTSAFVGKIRNGLTINGLESDTKRVGKDGRTIDTKHIGKRKNVDSGKVSKHNKDRDNEKQRNEMRIQASKDSYPKTCERSKSPTNNIANKTTITERKKNQKSVIAEKLSKQKSKQCSDLIPATDKSVGRKKARNAISTVKVLGTIKSGYELVNDLKDNVEDSETPLFTSKDKRRIQKASNVAFEIAATLSELMHDLKLYT